MRSTVTNFVATFLLLVSVSVGAGPVIVAPPSGASFPTEPAASSPALINEQARAKLVEGTKAANEKNFAAARNAYSAAAKLDPKSAGALLALGELELSRGDVRAAELALQEASGRTPHWGTSLLRAKIHAAKNEIEAAEKVLKEAIVATPDEPTLHLVLGDLFLNRLQLLSDARAAYERATALNPRLAPAQYALGVVLQAQGNPTGAREAFVKAKNLAPTIVLSSWALARLELAAGKPEAAISELNEALKRNPQFAQAYLDLGDAYQSKGDTAQALASYQSYAKARPEDAQGFQKIALLHHGKGDLKNAAAAYRQALKVEKDSALSLNNLAYLLAQSKTDLSEAEKHAKRAVELAPKAGPARATLGWVYRGQGKLADAEREIRAALSLTTPESAEQHAMLASVLLDTGKMAEARASAERSLALEASNTTAQGVMKRLK